MAGASFATRSGAARIEIGEGANQVVLEDNDQLNDAALRIERDQFEHKTQASSRPNKYIITGLEGKLELSIAEITLPQIQTLFFGSTTEDETDTYTRDDTSTVDIVKSKIQVADFAGEEILGQKVVIKPYPLVNDPGTTIPTTVTYNGVTYATIAEAEDAFLADATAYRDWVATWVTFPCGALTDINGTNLAYGLSTQQELKLMITSLPDNNGTRIIFGDETVA